MPAMPEADRRTTPDPGTDLAAAAASTHPSGRAAPVDGLVVRPFRGLRYDPGQVSDLAAVTSPPYDVIDRDDAEHLAGLDPHNVVQLILPRSGSGSAADGYAQARAALDQWLDQGVLVRDEQPTLYVYEQSAPGLLQRGLLAAVGLHDPADRVVLPHEDVMPGPVADRLELMRATSANLEPILLVYEGGGQTARVVEEVCAGSPMLETTAEDGLHQRLWAVTDPDVQQQVARDLAPRQALIADGHHRYATYRRLQAEHRAAGDGPGDWDAGLAMLVDSTTHPLRVHAIHRVVAGLSLAAAVELAAGVFRVQEAGHDLPTALGRLQAAAGEHPFVVTDGRSYVQLDDPDPSELEAAMPGADHSPDWRDLDASVLHALLLDRVWRVDDARTSYAHEARGALRLAARLDGVAVLMRPVTVETVHALAARGERMPRKSTSFGPKPRTGLVLRLLDR
jgi:uncharacterized protein (DUF1015 family)